MSDFEKNCAFKGYPTCNITKTHFPLQVLLEGWGDCPPGSVCHTNADLNLLLGNHAQAKHDVTHICDLRNRIPVSGW